MHDFIFLAVVAELSRAVCRFTCWVVTGVISLLRKLFGWLAVKIFRDSRGSQK